MGRADVKGDMVQISPNPDESRHGWIVSLAFWLCLWASAGAYASVALAPKLLAFLQLRHEQYDNQVRLVSLERQVRYLEAVVDALENDREFATELARIDFDAIRPGDERIAVGPALSLGAEAPHPLPVPAGDAFPWYAPLLRPLAGHRPLRAALLGAAALVTVLAFTFLQDAGSVPPRNPTAGTRGWLQRLAARYHPSPFSGRRSCNRGNTDSPHDKRERRRRSREHRHNT